MSKKSAPTEETAAQKPRAGKKITSSSTAEYFSKNLQQVGFSSPTKAVLTTVKLVVNNSLDECEDNGILPEINISIVKLGAGTMKNTDKLKIIVDDNGTGIDEEDISKVFGEPPLPPGLADIAAAVASRVLESPVRRPGRYKPRRPPFEL